MAKPRSRSKESISSSEDDDITPSARIDADGFVRPKKMRRLAKPASDGSIATNNNFGLLNDCSHDAEQGPPNESRNAYGARTKMQQNGTDASASPPERGGAQDHPHCTRSINSLVNINALCSDSHSTVKKILDNSVVHYFTYTSRDKKTKSLVLKGISLKFTEDEVKADIESRNLSDINVIKVFKHHFNKTNANNFFFIVQLASDTNCGSNGHPASYGGCPYLETAQSAIRRLKQQTRAVKQDKVRAISRRVDPNISYANIMDKQQVNFPPLPRTENAFPGREVTGSVLDYMKGSTGTRVPSEHKTQGAIDDRAPNTASSSLEELFVQLQKKMLSSIATHMEEMNKKLAENSAKIEFIMTHLYAN
ncbi:hypothetical protein M0802_012785 [Mischocyttarus mexicanus]|nr:hypothetical protein M0802_012785 [Mischocyttarus mexicanus]